MYFKVILIISYFKVFLDVICFLWVYFLSNFNKIFHRQFHKLKYFIEKIEAKKKPFHTMAKVDFTAEDNRLYSKPEWWDQEYKKCDPNQHYEWLTGPKDANFLKCILSYLKDPNMKILNVGCGISHIQDVIYDQGYHDITNIDISPTCIKNMKDTDTRGMKWEVADILQPFPFEPESFDLVIDKATLDAVILSDADKWDIEDSVYEIPTKYFHNVAKILKPGGTFIQITFGMPHFRKRLFEKSGVNWTVTSHEIQPDHSFEFYCYECVKSV